MTQDLNQNAAFSEKLGGILDAWKISKIRLATKIGVQPSTVFRWFDKSDRRTEPGPATRERVLQFLKITQEEFDSNDLPYFARRFEHRECRHDLLVPRRVIKALCEKKGIENLNDIELVNDAMVDALESYADLPRDGQLQKCTTIELRDEVIHPKPLENLFRKWQPGELEVAIRTLGEVNQARVLAKLLAELAHFADNNPTCNLEKARFRLTAE